MRLPLRLIGAAVVFLLFALLSVFAERMRTGREFDAVLSSYLSDESLHDAHDWGTRRGILVVVQREAQQPGMWRWRWLAMFDTRIRFAESSLITRISFTIANALPANLNLALHLPPGVAFTLAARNDLERAAPLSEFDSRFPNNLGYIAVSLPGFNATRTEAIFYIDHFCGLCGGGAYVLMRKTNGVWKVVTEHGTWSS